MTPIPEMDTSNWSGSILAYNNDYSATEEEFEHIQSDNQTTRQASLTEDIFGCK